MGDCSIDFIKVLVIVITSERFYLLFKKQDTLVNLALSQILYCLSSIHKLNQLRYSLNTDFILHPFNTAVCLCQKSYSYPELVKTSTTKRMIRPRI